MQLISSDSADKSILIKHDCLSGGIIHVTAFSGIFGTGVDHNFSFLNIKGD